MIKRLLAPILLAFLLAACSGHQKKPPVIDRSHQKSSHQQSSHQKKHTVRKWYKVRKGDTLYSIAWANSMHFRTLAYWNSIRPPYTLHPGQILRLKPRPKSKKYTTAKAKPKTTTSKAKSSAKPRSRPPTSYKKSYKKQTAKKSTAKTSTKATSSGKLRWTWPAQGRISYRYSKQVGGKKGIGIAGRRGQKVRAAAAGKVVYSGEGLLRYGKMIIVKHNNRYLSAYAHNQKLLVREGAWVKAGQQIAQMGSSGRNTTLVHFEIRRDGKPVNPIRYLPKKR